MPRVSKAEQQRRLTETMDLLKSMRITPKEVIEPTIDPAKALLTADVLTKSDILHQTSKGLLDVGLATLPTKLGAAMDPKKQRAYEAYQAQKERRRLEVKALAPTPEPVRSHSPRRLDYRPEMDKGNEIDSYRWNDTRYPYKEYDRVDVDDKSYLYTTDTGKFVGRLRSNGFIDTKAKQPDEGQFIMEGFAPVVEPVVVASRSVSPPPPGYRNVDIEQTKDAFLVQGYAWKAPADFSYRDPEQISGRGWTYERIDVEGKSYLYGASDAVYIGRLTSKMSVDTRYPDPMLPE